MDAWYEEEQQVYAHARDPYKRVDILPSSRYVRVVLGGVTIAETHRAHLLLETGLPTRYYIPMQDIRMECLEPTETTSHCPYKGMATYWSAKLVNRSSRTSCGAITNRCLNVRPSPSSCACIMSASMPSMWTTNSCLCPQRSGPSDNSPFLEVTAQGFLGHSLEQAMRMMRCISGKPHKVLSYSGETRLVLRTYATTYNATTLLKTGFTDRSRKM